MTHPSDPFAAQREKARELVAQMTLEEKAAICAGKDFWHTCPIPRLGIPSIMVTDGPNGLRKQAAAADHLGLNDSVPATCFPTAAATACSFDPALAEEMGAAMGEECLAEDVAVLLGPAANIKRSPLCGRNFEYFSEDPLLAGKVAAGMIRGIQSKNVGACMKHYLANSQEKARLTSDSVVDARALREIYLPAFEYAVKESQPWTLMCAYNQINGVYASDSKHLMTDIPRGKWGYQGAIMTDWGAMNDRVEAIRGGLDLEMPGPCDDNCQKIVKAVESGALSEADLNQCAERVTALVLQVSGNQAAAYDAQAHHALAGKISAESAVLLRRGRALPVRQGAKIAVIGAFAKNARYQGAGSGKIHASQVTSLCDALDSRGIAYAYAPGYDREAAQPDALLIAQAVEATKGADVILACVGLPDSFESEGFDRSHMDMPDAQNALVEALIATGIPVAVILSTGSAVILPWKDRVDSILLMYLTGQNGGSAAADLIFGEANPCGKLAETWPMALSDNPSYLHFGNGGRVEYRESIYVGYRYYDKAGLEVQYPFGHGLSYTEFAYSDLTLDHAQLAAGETVNVSLTVTNIGTRFGKETVQIYVAPPQGAVFRPVRELRGFTKVSLAPGESKRVEISLDARAFSYYNVSRMDWAVPEGTYTVEAASSSRDIRLAAQILVHGENEADAPDLRETAPAYYALPGHPLDIPKEQFEVLLGHSVEPWHPVRPYTQNSTVGELKSSALGRQMLGSITAGMGQLTGEGSGDMGAMLMAMLEDMPLRQFAMFAPEQFGGSQLEQMLAMLNAETEE